MELTRLIDPMLSEVGRRLGMRRATLWLIEEPGVLVVAAAPLVDGARREAMWCLVGEGPVGRTVEKDAATTVPDAMANPWLRKRRGADGRIRWEQWAFLCVPVRVEGRVVGALGADMGGVGRRELRERRTLLAFAADAIGRVLGLRDEAMATRERLQAEVRRLQVEEAERLAPEGLAGVSSAMAEVRRQVWEAAASDEPVLIVGGAGTGKDHAARAIHAASRRSRGRFVRFYCHPGMGDLALEGLFGCELVLFRRRHRRRGHVAVASGGVLYVDGIDKLDYMTTYRLLRLVRYGEYEREGAERAERSDVRLIAATRGDLAERVASTRCHGELAELLSSRVIRMPPLRERVEDLPMLAATLIARHWRHRRTPLPYLAPGAMDRLLAHSWPGNVRELEHVLRHTLDGLRCERIVANRLPPGLPRPAGAPRPGAPLPAVLEAVERTHIAEALEAAGGNRAAAARALGISERLMGLRVGKYGLDASG